MTDTSTPAQLPGQLITQTQYEELNSLLMPAIKWLNDNMHPHASIIVTPTSYELVEGVTAKHTTEYVKD